MMVIEDYDDICEKYIWINAWLWWQEQKKRKGWSHIRYTSNGHNQRSSPAAASADICLLPMFVKIFAIQDCPQADESTDWWWWLMFIQNIMASLKSKIVSVSVKCGNPCNPFPRIPCNFSFGHGLAQMRTRTRSKLPKGALSLHWNLIYSIASTGTELCYLKDVYLYLRYPLSCRKVK